MQHDCFHFYGLVESSFSFTSVKYPVKYYTLKTVRPGLHGIRTWGRVERVAGV